MGESGRGSIVVENIILPYKQTFNDERTAELWAGWLRRQGYIVRIKQGSRKGELVWRVWAG